MKIDRFKSLASSCVPIAASLGVLVFAAENLRIVPSYAADAVSVPAPALDEKSPKTSMETAILAGGCFWGMQGVFQHVAGVTGVAAGYTGGNAETAYYSQVSDGDTGHAESVRITYDPHKITYGRLLQIYFSVAHDPTELNRQGPDSGTQYRSAIFPTNTEQKSIADLYIAQLDRAHIYDQPIATKIELNRVFYAAETHHQNFLIENPTYPYIVQNDLPKISALKAHFPAFYVQKPIDNL